MAHLQPCHRITHEGSMAMLNAAIAAASDMGVPQCIVIVDASGEVLASLRMTGAKFLSLRSATAKARTSASIGKPSRDVPEPIRAAIGLATGGAITPLPGGMPITIAGEVVGGIGVGSGTGAEDEAVCRAALAAIGATVY